MSIATRRFLAAAAIPALALGAAACSSDDSDAVDEAAAAQEANHAAVLASYEGLGADSYTMESSMTVNEIDFMKMTNVVDGDSAHASQDLYMSAIMEAMGEEYAEDPETAEMMETMLADMHTEAIVVDEILYMQFAGGIFDAMSEEFGEDAWFTLDLTEDGMVGDIYQQFGSFDLGEQTQLMLDELDGVEEVSEGVYTGTLGSESAAMRALVGATGGAANGVEITEDTEVTVTLDENELLQSLEMTLPSVEGMTMHMVSEVVEIGGDYAIAAPETDDLHTFEEFISGAVR